MSKENHHKICKDFFDCCIENIYNELEINKYNILFKKNILTIKLEINNILFYKSFLKWLRKEAFLKKILFISKYDNISNYYDNYFLNSNIECISIHRKNIKQNFSNYNLIVLNSFDKNGIDRIKYNIQNFKQIDKKHISSIENNFLPIVFYI